jgi:AraC-like DNA-binding protein
MDKIDFRKWDNYFGRTEQSLVYASDRYTEAVFHFAEDDLPTGKVRTVVTPGLTLTELHIHTTRPFQMLDTQEEEGAESLFVLKGDVESSFEAYKHPLSFGSQNQSIQYNTNFSGTHLVRSTEFHALSISYDLSYINGLVQSGGTGPLKDLGKSIHRKENFLSTPYSMAVSGRIAEVIHTLQTCPFQGITRYIFIESKMMELFALQMEQLHGLRHTKPDQKWNRLDREKLFAVREFIETAYLDPPTLKELSYKFGLNEFKLKKGYKEFFQTTVFGHVHQLRMQKAKALLREQEMNISEVAFFIGYDNVSSFCTEFKKRFGCSPRMVLQ